MTRLLHGCGRDSQSAAAGLAWAPTNRRRGRLFKNIGGSTESYFPHTLPSATMINDQNFKITLLFDLREIPATHGIPIDPEGSPTV